VKVIRKNIKAETETKKKEQINTREGNEHKKIKNV
jgi:hypothetical protein